MDNMEQRWMCVVVMTSSVLILIVNPKPHFAYLVINKQLEPTELSVVSGESFAMGDSERHQFLQAVLQNRSYTVLLYSSARYIPSWHRMEGYAFLQTMLQNS